MTARFPFFPDEGWRARLDGRRLVLNGAASAPDAVLKTGDLIEYLDWDIPEPAVNTDFGVVYQDKFLIAINKPAGLPCHPGGRYYRNCLTMLLQARLHLETQILVNRLDRETSGLVLVATDRRAGKLLQQQFARRQVDKRYRVFVEGAFPDALEATGYIIADADSVVRKRRRFVAAPVGAPVPDGHPDADWAATRFVRLRASAELSELDAHPQTGRQHQIRATLLALGFPVVGDKLYGHDPAIFLRFCNSAMTDDDHRRLRLGRQALHAAALRLRHPDTQRPFEVEAPLPPDLQALEVGMV